MNEDPLFFPLVALGGVFFFFYGWREVQGKGQLSKTYSLRKAKLSGIFLISTGCLMILAFLIGLIPSLATMQAILFISSIISLMIAVFVSSYL